MTTQKATTHHQPCPECPDCYHDGAYWVASTPTTDTWACRPCGAEWTITVRTPKVAR
ncbi:MAG: hypothetical protein ACRDRP_04540 [Pseudonocardiaceae bacterium]